MSTQKGPHWFSIKMMYKKLLHIGHISQANKREGKINKKATWWCVHVLVCDHVLVCVRASVCVRMSVCWWASLCHRFLFSLGTSATIPLLQGRAAGPLHNLYLHTSLASPLRWQINHPSNAPWKPYPPPPHHHPPAFYNLGSGSISLIHKHL